MKLPAEFTLDLIKECEPMMRYDTKEDFAAWQRSARERLSELLGLPRIKKARSDGFRVEWVREYDEYTDTRFYLTSEEGYSFPLVLRVPKGTKSPMPLMICVQGHSTGMHVSLGEVKFPKYDLSFTTSEHCDYAREAAALGIASLSLEMRNFGEMGAGEDGLPECHIPAMNNILLGRTTIGERVHDISCAIDAALTRFDLFDPSKIMLMGISGGGTATYYAACIDERISLAVSVGAVCSYASSIGAIKHCVCNFVPGIARYFELGDLGGLIAPRRLIAVNGRCDPIFPDYGVRDAFKRIKELYTAAGVPENCILLTGEGGHICYPDITWPQVMRMMEEL